MTRQIAACIAIVLASSWCWAADGGGAGKAKAAKKPAAGAPGKAEAKPEAKIEELPPAEDPAVEALLATKSTTPAGWIRTGKVLAQLNRPELAKGFFRKVLEAKLDDQQLSALADEHGSGVFFELLGQPGLAPEGTQLAEAVLAARARLTTDPKRMEAAIKDLQNPSADVRSQGLLRLQGARRHAVGPLVAILADPKREAEHPAARSALLLLGNDAVQPLLSTLDCGDPKLLVQAIGLLAELGVAEAKPFLIAPAHAPQEDVRKAAEAALRRLAGVVPARAEGVKLLADQAERYFNRIQAPGADDTGQVEVWVWDPAQKQPVAKRVAWEQASRILAARLARDAQAMAPQDPRIRVLQLATMLEQAAYDNGLDKPLSTAKDSPAGQVAQAGAAVLDEVLNYAIEHGHAAAATAVARLLGQAPKAEALLYRGSAPSPLARAARHPDRRLRAAAVDALVRLQPAQPFAGASCVPESLRYFSATTGKRRVLVGSPRAEDSRALAGYLVGLGYQVDIATHGRDVLRMGQESPDYELILLDARIDQPPLEFLLQQLRRDYRTALLPVGVIARADQLDRAKHVVGDDPRAEALSRPHTPEAMRWQVECLKALAADPVELAERGQQAANALDELAQLLEAPKLARLYDWSGADKAVLVALTVPALNAKAIHVLEMLATPEAQQALVDLASRNLAPLATRKAAVEAFCRATERRGILLTTEQIRQQYERYNRSAALDADTQRVLARILDILEAPTKASTPAKPALRTAPAKPAGEKGPAADTSPAKK